MATKERKHTAPPRYDEAFRAGAVRMVTEQGRPSREVAKELGICIDTLRSWLKTAGALRIPTIMDKSKVTSIFAVKKFKFLGFCFGKNGTGILIGAHRSSLRCLVEKAVDYQVEGTGPPKADVLEYRLAGGNKLIIRLSGTEPKIKTYLSAVSKTVAEADAMIATLAEDCKGWMQI